MACCRGIPLPPHRKSFPGERHKYEGLPQIKRTWAKWKSHFQDAQEVLKRVIRHSSPSVDSFVSANAAADIHGIARDRDAFWPKTDRVCFQDPPPGAILADDFFESFSGLMDNMASAATNDKAVLEQLFSTMTTQYAAIKALLQEIKPQRGSNNSDRNPGSDRNPDNDNVRKF